MHNTGSVKFEVNRWKREVAVLLGNLRELDLGYPLGDDAIHDSLPLIEVRELCEQLSLDVDSELAIMYENCDGADFSDIHVGYFLHHLRRVSQGVSTGEPTHLWRVDGPAVLVFGTDGGGGRFVLDRQTGGVLYLPLRRVIDGIYQGDSAEVHELATSVVHFLWRLADDIAAFVKDRPDWEYLLERRKKGRK